MTPTQTPHPTLAGLSGNAGHPARDVLTFVTGGYWIDAAHLLHGPNVTVDLIEPETDTQPKIHPFSAILHTNGGATTSQPESLVRYYKRPDVVGESHFVVGYSRMIQTVPLNVRADCNYKANRWTTPHGAAVGAVSFECQDAGAALLAVEPFTVGQVGLMVGALVSIAVCYGVWCTAPAAWDDSGIGPHNLFPEWSKDAHSCPGPARTRQMDGIRQLVATQLVAFQQNVAGWKCGQGRPS